MLKEMEKLHGKIIDTKFIDGSIFESESYWLYLFEDGEVVKEIVK